MLSLSLHLFPHVQERATHPTTHAHHRSSSLFHHFLCGLHSCFLCREGTRLSYQTSFPCPLNTTSINTHTLIHNKPGRRRGGSRPASHFAFFIFCVFATIERQPRQLQSRFLLSHLSSSSRSPNVLSCFHGASCISIAVFFFSLSLITYLSFAPKASTAATAPPS